MTGMAKAGMVKVVGPGEITEWRFDDCTVVLDGDELYVIMDGPQGLRRMDVTSDFDDVYYDIDKLDEGSSPVGDGWKDGNGRTVCYGNGEPCDDEGRPLIVVTFRHMGRDYEISMPNWLDDVWASIDKHDEYEDDELWEHLTPDDIIAVNGGDYHGHATRVKSWADVVADTGDDEEGARE